VESVVGQGSAFWVEFPLVEGPVERLERLGGDAARANGTLSHAFVVLYIEDNLSNVRLVERIMAHRPGVELLPAMQGSLGLELARNHHPDLILLDLNLPDLEGDEVLRRLRDDPATRAIPVVVISADAMPGRIKQLREAGAHDYVTKPLDVAKLLGVMDELLAQGVH
jgi:CheY-like chemotaxis protein